MYDCAMQLTHLFFDIFKKILSIIFSRIHTMAVHIKRDSNPGSSAVEVDTMTTIPRHQGSLLIQGDQMSFLKNRPKYSPINFLSKFIHNFYR
jgi:hypothetical protein